MSGATCGAGTDNPFRAPEISSVFMGFILHGFDFCMYFHSININLVCMFSISSFDMVLCVCL